LSALAAERPDITLGAFLDASGLDLDDVYRGNRSWSDLREAAGLILAATGPHEAVLRRACGRLLHVDDPGRLDSWREWLRHDVAPIPRDPRRLRHRHWHPRHELAGKRLLARSGILLADRAMVVSGDRFEL
jgi:hypothetical protein